MANQLGHTGVTPRSYTRHANYRRFGLVRYAKQFKAFLAAQSTRLLGVPDLSRSTPPKTASQQVFEKLTTNTADKVRASTNYSDLA